MSGILILLGGVIVVFLDLQAIDPNQFAVPGDLQFERRNATDVDLHFEDGRGAPTEALRTFHDTVSFFHIDRFANSQRQGFHRRVFGKEEKGHREKEKESDRTHAKKLPIPDKSLALIPADTMGSSQCQ
jgi:hypothetical protein